jgi:drug/metabolite transporter (DMT)-like permease
MTPRAPLLFPLLALALVVSWSSGFVGIRFASDVASVPQILFGRSLFSALCLLPLALWTVPRITLRGVAEQGIYAFLGMFLYLGGFAWAIGLGVPTGLVALMADVVPLAIALLAAPLLGQPLRARQWLGTGLGLAGVALASAQALALGAAPVAAYALPLLGMLAFALSIVVQERRASAALSIVQRLTLQCLWASLMFAPFAWASGGLFPPLTADYALGMAWLVVLATYGGWLIYYHMLRLYPPAVVSATIYLSPPLTMVWAWALWSEPLTWTMAAGLVVTLAGVALVAARTPSAAST